MDINIFAELVANVGLPIALIIAMGAFIFILYKASEKREEILRGEIKENREINSKAIDTIALYAERLTVIESDVKEIKDIVVNK